MTLAIDRYRVALFAVLLTMGIADLLFAVRAGIRTLDGGIPIAALLVAAVIALPVLIRRRSIFVAPPRIASIREPQPAASPQAMAEAMARIIHDIRGPVVALSHVAELMARQGPTVAIPRNQLAQLIRSEATNIERTIDELMDVLSSHSGRSRIACERLNPRQLIEQSVAEFSLRESHILVVDYGRMPESLHGDAGKITRAITNLLSNAFKYAPAGSTVSMRCFRTTTNVLAIEVSDAGPGVPEEERMLIFEPFVRGAQHRQPDSYVPGSGIGLAVVRMVAHLHGGSVEVSDRPQGGAVFTLTLGNIALCEEPAHQQVAVAAI